MLSKDTLVAGIICPGGQQWHIIAQRDYAEGGESRGLRAFRKVASKVGGGGGASAIAENEDSATASITVEKHLSRAGKDVKWHGLHHASKLMPVSFNFVVHCYSLPTR